MLTQLSVEGALSHVQLLLIVSGGSSETIDLTDEIYTADVTIGKSMSFSLQGAEGEAGQDQATPSLTLSAVKDVSVLCCFFFGGCKVHAPVCAIPGPSHSFQLG